MTTSNPGVTSRAASPCQTTGRNPGTDLSDPNDQTRDDKSRDGENETMIAARWSAIGIQIAVSIIVGTMAGLWLDKKFGTDPWLTTLGVLMGSAAAFYDIYRLTKRTQKP